MNNLDLKKFNFHILIIDDDEKIRLLLKKFLENNEFRVSDAESTEEAKKIMQSLIFDLLVVDIMMPGQNGLDFLKEIRKTSQMPVLMLTAMSDPEDRLDGLEIGADDYMTKPFEPRELLLRIQNILKRFTSNVIETTKNDETKFGPFSFNINKASWCFFSSLSALYQNQAVDCLSCLSFSSALETFSFNSFKDSSESSSTSTFSEIAISINKPRFWFL